VVVETVETLVQIQVLLVQPIRAVAVDLAETMLEQDTQEAQAAPVS
jgi:predicted HAD superfamily phosphohydrolase YqeG